jgi:hypothetical protein
MGDGPGGSGGDPGGSGARMGTAFGHKFGSGKARLASAANLVNTSTHPSSLASVADVAQKLHGDGSLTSAAKKLALKQRAAATVVAPPAKATALVSDAARRAIASREKTRRKVALFSPRGSRIDDDTGLKIPESVSLFDRVLGIANSVSFQTLLYVSYVFVFQASHAPPAHLQPSTVHPRVPGR